MTPATYLASDSESLQADVMRFMAIIAFCLIAILALVRNVEPADVTKPEPEPIAVQEPQPVVAQEPEPIAVQEPEPVVAPEPEPVASVPEPLPPAPVAGPEPEVPLAVPSPVEQAASIVVEEAIPIDTKDAPPERNREEQGLILRFASDRDFLRLIARGDITVYAYRDSDVLSLDGSYRFLESRAPGQVYELLATSIPGLVVDALQRERADIRGYRWGVDLPRRISSQIERHLERAQSGQLVIDRYGDVQHVAAS